MNEDFRLMVLILFEFFNRNSNVFVTRDESTSGFNIEAGNEISISPTIRLFQLNKKYYSKKKQIFFLYFS
jgi:hypothetical protein